VGALTVGIALGVMGTLLFTAGDDPDTTQAQSQAAVRPSDAASTVSSIAVPQVGSDDPDAFGSVQISGTPLPRLAGGTDPAIGMVAPDLAGLDFEGNAVQVSNDGRAKIVVFLAHWCPYCREEVPVVRDWFGTTELPPDVDVYSVSPLTDFTRGNYPPRTWFEQEAWNVPLIVDDSLDSAANAFGLNAVPFWVLISPDGTVAGRGAGGGVGGDALTSISLQLSATTDPAESGS
jgi:thiol-disulfide isomerase/thioredoxin